MGYKSKYIHLNDEETISVIAGKIDPADEKIFAYKEVLDDFDNAEIIRIASYTVQRFKENPQKNENYLLDSLYRVKNARDIKIICGNPKRYERNFDESHKIIKQYMHDFDFSKFKSPVEVAINNMNHSKIIGTNNVLYIGSQNFTSASRKNYEAGVIIRDPSKIKEIYQKGFDEIWADSILISERKINLWIYLMLEEILDAAFVFGEENFDDDFYGGDSPGFAIDEIKSSITRLVNSVKQIGDIDGDIQKELTEEEIADFEIIMDNIDYVEEIIPTLQEIKDSYNGYTYDDLIQEWMQENKGYFYPEFLEEARKEIVDEYQSRMECMIDKFKRKLDSIMESASKEINSHCIKNKNIQENANSKLECRK